MLFPCKTDEEFIMVIITFCTEYTESKKVHKSESVCNYFFLTL